MKTHNDDKPFKSNNCNKEFRLKEELKKHVYSCKKVVPNMQEENNKVQNFQKSGYWITDPTSELCAKKQHEGILQINGFSVNIK